MYAVVRTGGKQVKVTPGDSVRVEKLDGATLGLIVLVSLVTALIAGFGYEALRFLPLLELLVRRKEGKSEEDGQAEA